MNITWIGSPNYDKNRKPIDRIVLHWFGDQATTSTVIGAVDNQFQKSGGTSAHYAVEKTTVHQYVREDHVAYHAGNYEMNQRSIGIEHSAGPNRKAADSTIQTSGRLVGELCVKYNIPIDRQHIIKHQEVKATQCPGTLDVDKIISLARQHAGQSNTNMITIPVTERDFLVGRASELKKVAEYLDFAQPDDIPAEHIINLIGGLKSSITKAQRESDEARVKAKNAEDEISRLRTQLLIMENDYQGAMVRARKLQEMNDDQGRVIGGLNEDVQRLETENRELRKDVASGLSARVLLRMSLMKFLKMI